MVKFDISSFFKQNRAAYVEETKNSKTMLDNHKIFNEKVPKDIELQLQMTSLLKGLMAASSGSGGDGAGSGGDYTGTPQEQFWQYFIEVGHSKASVAAMMGNIEVENAGAWKGDVEELSGGGGYGLIQWTGGRRTALENYAKEKGKSPGDFKLQLDYLAWEMVNGGCWIDTNGDGMGTYKFNEFKKTNDVEYATKAFCWSYERPAPPASFDVRLTNAKKYYNDFKDKKFDKASSGGGAKVDKMMAFLKRQVGGIYSQDNRNDWGKEPYTSDCSSLCYKAMIVAGVKCGYSKNGDNLGWTGSLTDDTDSGKYFKKVKLADRRAGDMIMCEGSWPNYGHVVMLTGKDTYIHAANPGDGIIAGSNYYINQAGIQVIRPLDL